MPKPNYIDIKDYYEKKGCVLLSRKKEVKELPTPVFNNYDLVYKANCGHFCKIKYDVFRFKRVGRSCPICENEINGKNKKRK